MIRSPAAPINTSDAPFHAPADLVLDLPAPPSVNKTRKVDWEGNKIAKRWRDRADPLVLWNRSARRGQPLKIPGKYELFVTLSEEHTRSDLDNGIKSLVDYLRRIGAVEDDSQQYFRRLTIEFGEAPEGCRVVIRSCAEPETFVSIGEAAKSVVSRLAQKQARGDG